MSKSENKKKAGREIRQIQEQAKMAFEVGDFLRYRQLNDALQAQAPDSDIARQARQANIEVWPGKWVWGPAVAVLAAYVVGWVVAVF